MIFGSKGYSNLSTHFEESSQRTSVQKRKLDHSERPQGDTEIITTISDSTPLMPLRKRVKLSEDNQNQKQATMEIESESRLVEKTSGEISAKSPSVTKSCELFEAYIAQCQAMILKMENLEARCTSTLQTVVETCRTEKTNQESLTQQLSDVKGVLQAINERNVDMFGRLTMVMESKFTQLENVMLRMASGVGTMNSNSFYSQHRHHGTPHYSLYPPPTHISERSIIDKSGSDSENQEPPMTQMRVSHSPRSDSLPSTQSLQNSCNSENELVPSPLIENFCVDWEKQSKTSDHSRNGVLSDDDGGRVRDDDCSVSRRSSARLQMKKMQIKEEPNHFEKRKGIVKKGEGRQSNTSSPPISLSDDVLFG